MGGSGGQPHGPLGMDLQESATVLLHTSPRLLPSRLQPPPQQAATLHAPALDELRHVVALRAVAIHYPKQRLLLAQVRLRACEHGQWWGSFCGLCFPAPPTPCATTPPHLHHQAPVLVVLLVAGGVALARDGCDAQQRGRQRAPGPALLLLALLLCCCTCAGCPLPPAVQPVRHGPPACGASVRACVRAWALGLHRPPCCWLIRTQPSRQAAAAGRSCTHTRTRSRTHAKQVKAEEERRGRARPCSLHLGRQTPTHLLSRQC